MDLPLTLKLISITFLLFAAAKFLGAGRLSARSIAFALFLLSVAGYLGCQVCYPLGLPAWASYLIHVGCFMVPWAFYLMNDSLFEDRFRFRWIHLCSFFFIEILNFYLAYFLKVYDLQSHDHGGMHWSLLRAVPQAVSLVYILAALLKTFLRRREDLVEERRRFRLRFIAVISAYMVLVVISEIALQGQRAAGLIDTVNATGVLLSVLYFLFRIFSVGENILGGFSPPAPGKHDEPQPVDQRLLQKLQSAMENDHVYMQEHLTIRNLAKQLDVHEYLLRRLINAGLGYRNFNDYLNELRIKEAARLLSDKNQAVLPVIRIAMDLGFGSLAPFNRAFKERQGMTPTEFRRISIGANIP